MESVMNSEDKYKIKPFKKFTTTKAQFELFRTEIEKLFDIFKISGFSRFYQHAKIDARAAYKISSELTVSFCLSTDYWQCEAPSDRDIQRSARHEFAHSLVGMIDLLAYDRHASKEELEREFERFVFTMEEFLTRLYEGEVEYK